MNYLVPFQAALCMDLVKFSTSSSSCCVVFIGICLLMDLSNSNLKLSPNQQFYSMRKVYCI